MVLKICQDNDFVFYAFILAMIKQTKDVKLLAYEVCMYYLTCSTTEYDENIY